MEKVIYLEPDDEITGVIDKIKKVSQDKVILVVPKAATILQSIVNLKILKNQAVRLNKEISLVTSDETGRNLASQIGLMVYRDLAKRPLQEEKKAPAPKNEVEINEKPIQPAPEIAQPESKIEAEEKIDTKKGIIDIKSSGVKFEPFKDESRAGLNHKGEVVRKKPLSLFKFKIIVLILFFLALLEGIFIYFYLPTASVNIILKAGKLDKTYELTAQKDAILNNEAGIIPAQVVSAEKEGSKDFAATGAKDVGEKAKGTVTITNETGTDQPLVVNTRLVAANGLVFRSTSAVTVPKAYLNPGGDKVNGSINVSVVADASGEAYNIGPSNFTIPGLPAAIQNKIYGRSTAAMSGGTTRKIKVVSEEDVKKAQNQLLSELVAAAKAEVLAQNNGENLIFDGSAGGTVISDSSNPQIGSEAETFKENLKAAINVMSVKKEDYYNVLTAKINQEIAKDKELLPGELEKTTETLVLNLDLALGKMSISSHVQAPVVAKMDLDAMKNNIKGKSKSKAIAYLKSFEEISDTQIFLWPFFARKIPTIPNRIFINNFYVLSGS